MYERIAEAIASDPGVCVVYGAPDTGKSTFCAFAASYCAERGRTTAVVDADVGQSDLGPPGTVGLGFVDGVVASLADISPADQYFVGSISPERAELLCAAGCANMVRAAIAAGAEVVFVDTTGAVTGVMGRMLKAVKLDLVRPDYVVALERRDELAHLFPSAARRPRLLRVPALPGVRRRSKWERAFVRRENFARHFSATQPHTIDLDGDVGLLRTYLGTGEQWDRAACSRLADTLNTGVLHAEWVPEGLYVIAETSVGRRARAAARRSTKAHRVIAHRPDDFRHLYLGVRDETGEHIGVGLLEECDFLARRARLLITPRARADMRDLVFGGIRIRPEGKELGFSPAGLRR